MHELKTGRKRPYKQRIAIALAHARKMGVDIPRKMAVSKLGRKAHRK